jgi:hypothetical protein
MVFSWFDARAEKEFGASMARFFMERSPLGSSDKTAKFVAKKQEELLSKMSHQIVTFSQAHRPNIYKKAQLGNSFKWTLKDAGYESSYVDQLTSWLMLRF